MRSSSKGATNRNIKATTTNQIENTELKNTMTVLKNSIEGFNS